MASYLQARSSDGQWLLRVEDIDQPRAQPGATDMILAALDAYGFDWDGPVTYQSASRDAHDAAIRKLIDEGMAYPCGCSRRDLADVRRGPLGTIYPGTCRDGSDATEFAIRVRTDDEPITFDDGLQGLQTQQLERESGDFVILRRDGLVAYQLAVVVDDYLQGITDIVRGIDLMDSTARQIWLQRLLGYPRPEYIHLPVAINERAQKLSKSHGAGAVSADRIAETLVIALDVLGQEPPPDLAEEPVPDVWQWARNHWHIDVLEGIAEIPVGHIALAYAKNQLS